MKREEHGGFSCVRQFNIALGLQSLAVHGKDGPKVLGPIGHGKEQVRGTLSLSLGLRARNTRYDEGGRRRPMVVAAAAGANRRGSMLRRELSEGTLGVSPRLFPSLYRVPAAELPREIRPCSPRSQC
uniref:Uncharacterized protein n=1 Tax=Setaria viridis TaxID=4556 RepID=A0A4U6TWT8_SETVI|nr:hypothetical protein SEVIR_7G262700v2 [Setaria viridis]TKW06773.1 hypothetical protein SEVIR_7G262700v2 [Setaria viridis]TKW06774.1 hypothetical protein SEVIR_7G262700v2 [Setaria viridis]